MLRLILFVACLAVTGLAARRPTTLAAPGAELVLPRAELLRAIGGSHLQLVADFYWLKAINLVRTADDINEGRALLALGSLITDLDPHFEQAYWTIALIAPAPPENRGGNWANSLESAALLKKGLKHLPLDNRLCIVLTDNLISYQHDYLAAAEVLKARSLLPDPLPYFAAFATRLFAASAHFDASREFARAMLAAATDEQTRKLFEERLKLIDLEEVLVVVEDASRRYLADHPDSAPDVGLLLSSGYLPQPPIDPFGGEILLEGGKAHSTAVKRLEVYRPKD